jgi:hypothetical protein
VQKVTLASWASSTTATFNLIAGAGYQTLSLPQPNEVTYVNGGVQIQNSTTHWTINGLLAGKTIQYSFTVSANSQGSTTDNDISVQAVLIDTDTNNEYVISNYDYNATIGATTFSGIITHINTVVTNAQLVLKIKSDAIQLNDVRLLSGQVRIQ